MKHLITVVLISLSWVSSALAQDVPVGACCLGPYCHMVPEFFCEKIGGECQDQGSDCTTKPCGDVVIGACCLEGMCKELPAELCDLLGGDYQGHDTYCMEDTCNGNSDIGACCINDSCYEVPVEICELENGECIGGSCETADCGCVNALDAAC